MKSIVVKSIIVVLLLSLPTTIALNPSLIFPTEKNNMVINIKTNQLDKTLFYALPANAQYNNIDIISHKFNKVKEEQPVTTFFPTTEQQPNISLSLPCTKNKPYYFDILKKGNIDVARIHIPSTYYSDDYKYTTTSFSLQINYQKKPKFFTTQKDKEKVGTIVENSDVLNTYQSQSEYYPETGPVYVIITNETLWGVYHHHYKDWVEDNLNLGGSGIVSIINISEILSNSLYWVNGTYGDATNETEGNPWMPDGKEITTHHNMFNDTQAQIRNYIRRCHGAYNTRYILLGGNKDILPPRMVCSYAYSTCPGCTGPSHDYSHASDMYYSCLHYSMNNNTNSYWMENDACGNPFDEIDWGYDLCVGRVPTNTVQETLQWINKTKNYTVGNNHGNYLSYGIVAAKNVDGDITDSSWLMVGDEFPTNISFVNNQNLTEEQFQNTKEYVNGNISNIDGIALILQSGHFGSFWPYYNEVLADNDATPNFYYSEGCEKADFGTDTTSHFEQLMSADGSIFGGIGNSASGWFVASTYYVEEMMNQMFNETTGNFTMSFCQAHNDAREIYGHDPDCVWGMIVKETNYFGDPAIQWVWNTTYTPEIANLQFTNISNHINNSFIYTNETIVFNWTKTSNTSKYNLQIAKDSDFTNMILNLTNVSAIDFPTYYIVAESNISFQLPDIYELEEYTTYYCRVREYAK